jgi:hypothetical protein
LLNFDDARMCLAACLIGHSTSEAAGQLGDALAREREAGKALAWFLAELEETGDIEALTAGL